MTYYKKKGELVVGLKAIAALCGVSTSTMSNWIKKHAFPACKLPNGQWGTTRGMLDAWVFARQLAWEQKRNKKG